MGLRDLLFNRKKSAKGQTFSEYALIILAVAITAYTAYFGVGTGVKQVSNGLIIFINAATAAL
jgi:hypothetical protein